MIKYEPWYDKINSVSHPKTIKFKTRKIFQPPPPPPKKGWLFSSYDDDDWHSLSRCRAFSTDFLLHGEIWIYAWQPEFLCTGATNPWLISSLDTVPSRRVGSYLPLSRGAPRVRSAQSRCLSPCRPLPLASTCARFP